MSSFCQWSSTQMLTSTMSTRMARPMPFVAIGSLPRSCDFIRTFHRFTRERGYSVQRAALRRINLVYKWLDDHWNEVGETGPYYKLLINKHQLCLFNFRIHEFRCQPAKVNIRWNLDLLRLDRTLLSQYASVRKCENFHLHSTKLSIPTSLSSLPL